MKTNETENRKPAENRFERFGSRVADYQQFRPGYPGEIIIFLQDEIGLSAEMKIADVGSGTGIFTKLLLENGHSVYGIEPNEPMRKAAEKWLAGFSNFESVDGNSEATGLPDESVDVITAAQAFHWFHQEKAFREFQRVLKNPGYLVLLWNDRRTDSNRFLREYEDLIVRNSTDYAAINHKQFSLEVVEKFCCGKQVKVLKFENLQALDFEGLGGRLFSSSYIPNEPDEVVKKIKSQLRELFEKHRQGGEVVIEYDTVVYVCCFNN